MFTLFKSYSYQGQNSHWLQWDRYFGPQCYFCFVVFLFCLIRNFIFFLCRQFPPYLEILGLSPTLQLIYGIIGIHLQYIFPSFNNYELEQAIKMTEVSSASVDKKILLVMRMSRKKTCLFNLLNFIHVVNNLPLLICRLQLTKNNQPKDKLMKKWKYSSAA